AHELPRVLLASSPLARKGALELREALRGLPLQLVLPPGAQEAPELWDGIAVVRAPSMADGIAGADVVVLPAWIEHQPRRLLLALALGKPVVASDACGLARDGTWHCVEAGDGDDGGVVAGAAAVSEVAASTRGLRGGRGPRSRRSPGPLRSPRPPARPLRPPPRLASSAARASRTSLKISPMLSPSSAWTSTPSRGLRGSAVISSAVTGSDGIFCSM